MNRPSIPSLIPVSAHSADNKIIDVVSKRLLINPVHLSCRPLTRTRLLRVIIP